MQNDRLNDLIRFYTLLEDLEQRVGGKRILGNCHGKSGWPNRGVYFFFEPGEQRSHTGSGLRVVRVGTHAVSAGSRTTLWNRLATHRGTVRTGGGNHRGSIFRLLVGKALMQRHNRNDCATWGQGSSAAKTVRQKEESLEADVSLYMGRMSLLWLKIDDAASTSNLRSSIERNSIALLSNYCEPTETHIDTAADSWLGRSSDRQLVRGSGLWNNNHVNHTYEHGFLDEFERLVRSQ